MSEEQAQKIVRYFLVRVETDAPVGVSADNPYQDEYEPALIGRFPVVIKSDDSTRIEVTMSEVNLHLGFEVDELITQEERLPINGRRFLKTNDSFWTNGEPIEGFPPEDQNGDEETSEN